MPSSACLPTRRASGASAHSTGAEALRHDFGYDASGNRTDWDIAAGPSYDYYYDSADQLANMTVNGTTWSYYHDGNGAMTTATDGTVQWDYYYNHDGRLYGVNKNTSSVLTNTYNPDGTRRSLGNGGTVNFVYDGQDVLAEYDSSWANPEITYTHGPGIDEPVVMTSWNYAQEPASHSEYYIHRDSLGSARQLTNSDENTVTTYTYDAWGKTTESTITGNVSCRFRYTGREWDVAAQMYYYRARYYDQDLGLFLSRDPLTSNSPGSFIDSNGSSSYVFDPELDPSRSILGEGSSSGLVTIGPSYKTRIWPAAFIYMIAHPFGADNNFDGLWYGTECMGSVPKHLGTDVMLPLGTPIPAPTDMLITEMHDDWVGGWDMREESFTKNGNTTYRYWVKIAHVDGSHFHQNQQVTMGTYFTYVNNKGNSGGPHIHYEATRADHEHWYMAKNGDYQLDLQKDYKHYDPLKHHRDKTFTFFPRPDLIKCSQYFGANSGAGNPACKGCGHCMSQCGHACPSGGRMEGCVHCCADKVVKCVNGGLKRGPSFYTQEAGECAAESCRERVPGNLADLMFVESRWSPWDSYEPESRGSYSWDCGSDEVFNYWVAAGGR